MFLPKQLLELEAKLPALLPPALRRFLARRPQANGFPGIYCYPRAWILERYTERLDKTGDAYLLPIAREDDSAELLVELFSGSRVWTENADGKFLVATTFTYWLQVARADKKNGASKKLVQAARTGDLDRIKKLLQQGADVNEQDSGGNTPLMAALLAWQYEAAAFLLEQSPDLSITDRAGHTALMWACYRRQPVLVKRMLELNADVHARSRTRDSMWQFIYGGPDNGKNENLSNIVEILIDAGLSPIERSQGF